MTFPLFTSLLFATGYMSSVWNDFYNVADITIMWHFINICVSNVLPTSLWY